jgi:SpoVK/Ycf46/Vps4 family AAA+-type ATPase
MAAEVVANELGRDLYRVDLAQVVSKYIGETEKNLAQVFSAAEKARCVLLFDEADALFGRRTEVRDSHDRYANLEVSYLLQRFEYTEHAVVLLATNRRQNIDEAFLRRFRFVIDFQVPDATLRRQLWRLSFPRQTRVENVDFDRLADKLVLTGASIRNIALAASFLAAAENVAIQPEHLSHAIRRELEKLGQPAQITAGGFSLTRPAGGRA